MKPGDIEEEVRAARVQDRWRRLNLFFAGLGEEVGSLFIIALALAILCAPWAFGIGVSWGLGTWARHASGSAFLGWTAAIVSFAFFARYIWGSRLQCASRRAAEALIAAK